jgi:hypothetical protein
VAAFSTPGDRPSADYTARMTAQCGDDSDGMAMPLEANWIKWQK